MEFGIVTVFGGAGFVGRYVVAALVRAGARVRVACRRPEDGHRLKPMGDVGQVTTVAANIRIDASVQAAVAGSDTVINLDGILFERGRQTFRAVHTDGAGRIARLAAAAGGGIANLKTTVAVSSKKAVKAMRAGKRIQKGFKSAGQ